MAIEAIKASGSFMRAGSFFFTWFFLLAPLTAAEVSRSVSLEGRVRLLEQQLTSANRMRAESQFEVNGLKKEIRMLRGLVEEQGYQLQQIITRQRELYRDIENRLGQASTGSSSINAAAGSTQQPNPITVNGQTTSNTSVGQLQKKKTTLNSSSAIQTKDDFVDDSQVRASYDKIFPLVKSKRYDDAIGGYQQFIAQYPESIFVANSRYWLAQIYSVQGRVAEAEREYLNVAQQYDKSPKAPEAWLKLGKLYERLGQNDKALDAYNQVVTQYANSTAAQIAIKLLQTLKLEN